MHAADSEPRPGGGPGLFYVRTIDVVVHAKRMPSHGETSTAFTASCPALCGSHLLSLKGEGVWGAMLTHLRSPRQRRAKRSGVMRHKIFLSAALAAGIQH